VLKLDVGTLAFSTAIVSLVTAMTIVAIGGMRRRDLPWGPFAASASLYGIGLLMIVFRPAEAVHPFITGGNILVLLSTLAAHAGACAIAGRKAPLIAYGVATLGLSAGYWYLSEAIPTINARIALISLVRLPFFIHGILILHAAWRKHRLRSTMAIEVSCASWVGLLSVRIADVVARENHISNFLSLDGYQALYFMLALLSIAILGIAVLLMDVEREEDSLSARLTVMTAALQRAKETAEAALDSKSRFLAATGHDLRQAVHALRLLLTAAADGPPADKADTSLLFQDMEDVIAGMAEQLNTLMDLARLEAGIIAPSVSDCALDVIFRRVEGQFRRSARASDVDLRFVASSQVVQSDPALLSRILGNLIANGIKFAPGGRVLVGCRRRGSEIHIQVCDDGIGIPPDKTAEIFEEYRQLHNPARQHAKGLGLGLAIIKRLTELLGHGISVTSTPGQGTIFSVRIPATPGLRTDLRRV
jgi:signal transduction histidine kinase